MRSEIHDGWSAAASAGPGAELLGGRALPAAVPGCVHLDLLAAGEIPDPYLGRNEELVAWVGRTSWTYSATVGIDAASDGERVDLVADGLDTVAEVRIDGTVVGRTRDMHRSHRWDVTGLVADGGSHVLEVAFEAPLDAAEASAERLGARPHVNHHPYNALRKNASSFGWDWGPDLPSSGIWRPLAVERWRTARLAAVRPIVDVRDDGTGILDVRVEVERAGTDADLEVAVEIGGRTTAAAVPAGEAAAAVRVEVPDVRRWWPRGYGDQPLHDVAVSLTAAGTEIDRRDLRVGFRTVAVESEPDDGGTSFALVVNGERVLVRGYNWIPDDAFPSRVGRARYADRLQQAADSNANLLRVWGGGIYESDDFYDVCDELGLLVWQDFAFACAAYAEEPELADEVAAEARQAVVRLAPHPSLALWCGGNECLWGHEDWDWKEPLDGRTWGSGYYRDLLPAIVAELDPTRPYIPGSPFSPRDGVHPNHPSHGPMHIWDVWNQKDYTSYLEYRPRFVSEFGFQGPPTWATLTRALAADDLDPWSPAMLVHQKAEDGNGKLERGMAPHLPAPTTFDDWHWATSLNQARAVALGVEHFRSLAPHCTGAVVWQLNDCWPVISWAAVDGDGRRKPLWYSLRRAFADRALVLLPEGDGLVLGIVNDSPEPWDARVSVRRIAWDGEALAADVVPAQVPARSAVRIPLPAQVAAASSPADELLVAEADGVRAVRPFVEDSASALPGARLDAVLEGVDGGYVVHVSTDVVARDVALLVDRVDPDAEVDDMLVTLLPGETASFAVTTARELDVSDLAHPLVLRCANQLVAAARGPVPAG